MTLEKRLRLLPAVVLIFVTLACSLGGGDPTDTPVPIDEASEVQTNTEQPATPEVGAPEPADTSTPTQEPTPTIVCPQETVDTTVYIDWDNGFCLLYPSYFEQQGNSEALSLFGPALDSGTMETIRVYLTVEYNGPADGLDGMGYADKWQEIFVPDMQSVMAENTNIGGQSAVILYNLPGYATEQSAYIVANESKYRITMMPQREDIAELAEHTSLVWDTILDSIVFFEPHNDRPVVRSGDVCPAETADTHLYTSLEDGYCMLYPAADFQPAPDFPGEIVGGPVLDTVESFGEVRTSLTVGTYGNFPDQTPREILEPRSEYIDETSLVDITISGYPAVVHRNPGGPWASRHALISKNGFIYTIVAQPWEPERWPQGMPYLDNLWTVVVDSLAFFDQWR
ncbi:MAG: hypothetical protein MUO76_21160 [Anaerolineaceae bacterium]|nr:hypothetical protein [Anaerolineaceae bacterium]